MGYMYVPTSVRSNVELQAEKMRRQIWRDQLYNRFVGFANRMPTEGGVKYVTPIGMGATDKLIPMKNATGIDAPINVFEDFSKGGTDMQIRRKRLKFGKPIFGDDTLQGRGEASKWDYATLRVAEVSDAVNTKAGHFSEQVYYQMLPDLVSQAKPELTDKFGRYINSCMIKDAIFYHRSYELRLASTSHGRGISAISHPNMYVPLSATGWVSYNASTGAYTNLPATAGYETDVETAINSLTDTATKHFTTALVDKMRFLLPQRKVLPSINIGGNMYYLWIITSAQAKQLTADSVWKQNAREILPREKADYQNWLFTGALGMYNGFVFLEDIEGWGAHTNANQQGYVTAPTSGTVMYGPEDTVNSAGEWNKIKGYDVSPYQASVILGTQAVNIGFAKKLEFTEEIWDHKRKSEVGAWHIAGAELNSYFDSDNQTGAGTDAFLEHNGSAVVFTYSPPVYS